MARPIRTEANGCFCVLASPSNPPLSMMAGSGTKHANVWLYGPYLNHLCGYWTEAKNFCSDLAHCLVKSGRPHCPGEARLYGH